MNLDYGPYHVGYKHFELTDSSRFYHRQYDWTNVSSPRPIVVSFWYPTKAFDKTISILHYLSILKQEEEWENLPDELILNWFLFPNNRKNRDIVKESAKAIPNAPVMNEAFPLIMYSPGYEGTSVENFVLLEYLASHGYYIFSYPSRGAKQKWMSRNNTLNAENQARDLEFLLAEAGNMVKASHSTGVIGHSFGSQAQILTQMRNNNITAIVSLDGSEKYSPETLEKSLYYEPQNIDIPYVHFSQKDIPLEVLQEEGISESINSSFSFFDSIIHSEAASFKLNHLTHGNFTSLGTLLLDRDARQDMTDKEILYSYSLLCKYTLLFFDDHLKNKVNFFDTIGTNSSGHNKIELLTHEFRQPKPKSFGFEDFNLLGQRVDYRNLPMIKDSIMTIYPEFHFNEWQLNNLGLQLGFSPKRSKNGVKVLLFATSLFPSSSNLFDSLGEVYLHSGNKKEAVKSFRKAFELDPKNQNAVMRLKSLSN